MTALTRGIRAEDADLREQLSRLDGVIDPYPTYAALHERRPVLAMEPGLFLASRYRDCLAILTDTTRFRSPGDSGTASDRDNHQSLVLLSHLMNAQNPPRHTRMRRSVAPMFTRHRVHRLRARLELACERLFAPVLDRLDDGEIVDVHRDFSVPFPAHAVMAYLGIPETDHSAIVGLIPPIFAAAGPSPSQQSVATADEATGQLLGYVTALARRRRADPGDDVLSQLVTTRPSGTALAPTELTAVVAGLIIAGHETTAAGIDGGIVAAAGHPDRLAGLEHPQTVGTFVDEVLRYDSPVQYPPLPRVVATPTVLSGVALPVGSRIWPILGAANRDPAVFQYPDRFDPRRAGSAPLSFGAGIHHCLGANMARLEMAIALRHVLLRFPCWRLAIPPARRRTRQLRAFDALPIERDR